MAGGIQTGEPMDGVRFGASVPEPPSSTVDCSTILRNVHALSLGDVDVERNVIERCKSTPEDHASPPRLGAGAGDDRRAKLIGAWVDQGFRREDVAAAVGLYGARDDQVLKFLVSCGLLQNDLGFDADRSRDALIRSNGDEQEAINRCLQGT